MGITAPLINDRREIFGWTMYDWANSAFSTTVVTVFLGPYLTAISEAATKNTGGLLYLGNVPIRFDSFFTYAVSASVLLQVTFLPVLGSLATIATLFIGPSGYWLGAGLFVLVNVAQAIREGQRASKGAVPILDAAPAD